MNALSMFYNKNIKSENNNIRNKKRDSTDVKIKRAPMSPKKILIKTRFSKVKGRSNSIAFNDEIGITKKKLALFGPNRYVDFNLVKNLDKKNKKYMEILSILNKNNKLRDKNEKELIYNFLIKNSLRETVSNDLEYFHLNIKKFINYILDHIILKEYTYFNIIYYDKDIPNFFYLILNDSVVGEYEFNIKEESIDFESYLFYLNHLTLLYTKYQEKKAFKQKVYLNDENEDNNFIDSHLIETIIDENNKVYSILNYEDIKEAKEIIIKAKIYNLINANAEEDIEEIDEEKEQEIYKLKYHDKIIQIHKDYNADLNIINFDKVLNGEISYRKYISFFKRSVLIDNTALHYIKLLNNPSKNIIKKIKYKKNRNYKAFDYFGYFPNPKKNYKYEERKFIVRNETNSTLLLCFNKAAYYNNISSILKEEKEKSIIYFHNEYIFKDVNMEYFRKKIFNDFILNIYIKGENIFKQSQKNNDLIMLKEGIIELQMKNISLSELGNNIEDIKNLLIKYIKDNKTNSTKLIESILELELDKKTNLQSNFVKEIVNKRLNIIFSRCSKGFFGEYECFFKIPSLLTGIIVSDICEAYFYSYKKFQLLNSHTISLNEKLEDYSFNKLLNLLKRMCNIYNSYWKILNNHYNNLIDKEKINDINNSINKNKINNMNNIYNNDNQNNEDYYKIENYNIKRNISHNKNIDKLKISIPLMSQTIFGKKFKEIINNKETLKNEKSLNKIKICQLKEKKEKKIKLKGWDFNFTENNKISINSQRIRAKNLVKNNSIKKNDILIKEENNKNKGIDDDKSSLIANNYLKNKLEKMNKKKKIKINKKLLYNVILPPILRTNGKNNDNFNTLQNSISKSQKLKKNDMNLEELININFKQKDVDNKNINSKNSIKRNKHKFDIRQVSIGFLKSRTIKYNYLIDSDKDEYDNSGGEYYYTNE